jgi:hypothetical protein
MTFEKKVFSRRADYDEKHLEGGYSEFKCPGCNYETDVLYRIGKASKEELCGFCLMDLIIARGYHIREP